MTVKRVNVIFHGNYDHHCNLLLRLFFTNLSFYQSTVDTGVDSLPLIENGNLVAIT